MKLILKMIVLIIAPVFTYGQWISIDSHPSQKPKIELIHSDISANTVSIRIGGFNKQIVNSPDGDGYVITMDKTTPILEEGAPDLPKLAVPLIVPDKNLMELNIIKSNFVEYPNIEIAPSKGNLLRTVDPSSVPFRYGNVYKQDAFFPEKIAELRRPYILRDYRGQTALFYPFQYNPQTKILRVYTEIEVEINSTNQKGENELDRRNELNKVSSEFDNIYSQHFANYNCSKYTPLEEEGNMLVICHDDWLDDMQPFVDWKKLIGRPTELVAASTIGANVTDIKNFITNYYLTNGLTYVLLVGDANQIPTNIVSDNHGDSDNTYGYIEGDDHYQEVFVGRFSAESSEDVVTQVQRSIDYEKGNFADVNWLNRNIGIASEEGPGDDNELDYEHVRNIQAGLESYNYVSSVELFEGSQGGNDLPNNPSASMVGLEVNSGASLINYTGHGSNYSWVTSGFSNSNINGLSNVGQLPYVWSVACFNGNFVGHTCFAETWLRANDGSGNPTGAIAMFASTIGQSWDPPMEAQDEMNLILSETHANNLKRTFGGISINGCFSMNDNYGAAGDIMTDTWTIFGDPSLMVRTDIPTEFANICYPTIIAEELAELIVYAELDGAIVCVSCNNEIIGTGYVSDGEAKIPLENIYAGQQLDIVATGLNKIPYYDTINVISSNGPYIVLRNFEVAGSKYVNYGQTENIDITLMNIGADSAIGVVASLSTEDEYVTSLANNENVPFGNIANNNDSVSSTGQFTITLSDTIPNGHIAVFVCTISDSSNNVWEYFLQIKMNAPEISSQDISVLTDNGSPIIVSTPIKKAVKDIPYRYVVHTEVLSGNGTLDPGEDAELKFILSNIGDAPIYNAHGRVACNNEYVHLVNDSIFIDSLEVDMQKEVLLELSISDSAKIGDEIKFSIVFNEYYNTNIPQSFGLGSSFESFETADFTSLPWEFSGDKGWVISNESAIHGLFSAKSGDVGINQSSSMELQIEVYSDANISFHKKVSSNVVSDRLLFYIDGELIDSWYGDDDWSYEAYSVSAGEHQLLWLFDNSYSSPGESSAWIDYLILPPQSQSASKSNIEYSWIDLPDWLTLTDNNDGTAVLEGIPSEDNLGNEAVSIKASVDSLSAIQSFIVEVLPEEIDGVSCKQISIFPNPANQYLFVHSDSRIDNVSIFTIQGKKIINKPIEKSKCKIDLRSLEKGIYFIEIQDESGSIIRKIIVG